MAKKQTVTEDQTLDTLNNSLTSTGEKIIKNRKKITIVGVCLLLIGGALAAYFLLWATPQAQKAMDAYNNVMLTAQSDTAAIKAYQKVVNDYSGTKGANLAALESAELLYDQGKYQEALNNLEKFSTKEKVMMSTALCLKGDCYTNLKKYNEALEAYQDAIDEADGNDASVPRFLDKMANVYDAQKQYAKALECYETIKKDYPSYGANGYTVDAYIAREKARLGKK